MFAKSWISLTLASADLKVFYEFFGMFLAIMTKCRLKIKKGPNKEALMGLKY